MAVLEDILVSDLDKLSAEDLRSRGVIKVKDPENLTTQHVDKLRALVNGLDNSCPFDLGAVDEKLRNFTQAAPTSPRSRSSLSATPDPNDPVNIEALFQGDLRREHMAYHDLILDGGQPSHRPDDAGFDILKEPGENADIISYWTNGWPNKRCILREQWWHWQEFREYQDRMRQKYWKPEWFERRTQFVRNYRMQKGLGGDVCLHQSRKEQSRLDDWKEFQFREYRTADGFVRDMERAAEDKKASESRLQAAIDAGTPADEIESMKVYGVIHAEARRGTAEIELQRHSIFLKWIDEQLPIIASECRQPGTGSETRDDQQSSSVSTHLGKRKRSTEDTTDRTASYRKLSQSSHVKDIRRKVELDNEPKSTLSPATNTDTRGSTPVDLHQQSNSGLQLRKSKRIANFKREAAVPNPTETSLRPGEFSVAKHGQPIEKRVAGPSDSHVSKVSEPSPNRPSPKPGIYSGERERAKQATALTRNERRQVQAAPNGPTRVAARKSERVVLRPVHSSQISKARAGESKARSGRVVQMSLRGMKGCDDQQSTRQDKRQGKNSTNRGRKSAAPKGREYLSVASEPLRRSQRISQMPTICYLK